VPDASWAEQNGGQRPVEFENRAAVVTGGGNGIGRAIALALAGAAMHVVIADIDAAAAERTAESVRQLGRRSMAVPTDVNSDDALRRLADRTAAEFGRVDLVLNHARAAVGGPIEHIPRAEWSRLFDFNVGSQIRGVTTFLPHLMKSSGHIVNRTSSMAVVAGHPLAPMIAPYLTTKAAIIAWTPLLADYLRPRGVGVSLLAPDHTATGFDASARFYGTRPGGLGSPQRVPAYERIQTPEEVAEVLVDGLSHDRFLLSATPEIDIRLQHSARARLDPAAMRRWYVAT
jgi:NAD(P)-dependent dehydrogenase (short-subunit alcohol dehydrogenase family)